MNRNVLARGPRSRIPLTVVGGPEGAGKTTLLRHLLTNNDGRRIAVLLEDPASLALTSSSIARTVAHGVQLPNGSACFGLDGDIGPALQTMHGSLDPDQLPQHVMVEARSTASLVRMSGYAFLPGFRPGGMVSVLSAPDLEQMRIDGIEPDLTLAAQLQQAELLVMNKVDALKPAARSAVRRWTQQRATRGRLIEADRCSIPPAMILGAGREQMPVHAVHAEWSSTFSIDYEGHQRQMLQPRHANDYRAWLLSTRSTVDVGTFRSWANRLPDNIIRGDGILRITGEPSHQFQFHRCGIRWTLSRGEPWGSSDEPLSWVSLVGFGVRSNEPKSQERMEELALHKAREPRHFRPPLHVSKDPRSIGELS